MSLGIGLGLTIGNPVLNRGKAKPKPFDLLCTAISNKVYVTLAAGGDTLTFAPLAISGDEINYDVDGYVGRETPGNRPLGINNFLLSELSAIVPTEDHFEVHPASHRHLRRLQNVKCIVQFG